MKLIKLIILSISYLIFFTITLHATTLYVSSQQEFNTAHNNATKNDSIVWREGTYPNIYMDISKDDLFITADKE